MTMAKPTIRGREAHQPARRPRRAGALLAGFALACAASAVPAGAAFAGPAYGWYNTPAAEGTYVLKTLDDWEGFSNVVNGTADADADGTVDAAFDFAGKTVVLGDSINLLGSTVAPVGGQEGTAFNGTFDGHDFELMGFTVDSSTPVNVGLFGAAGPDSVIRNVAVLGGKVVIDQPAGGAVVSNVGLVAGSSAGDIVNVRTASSCSVSVKSAVAQTADVNYLVSNVGGIAGICTGNVERCSNAAAISVAETSAPLSDNEQSTIAINIGGVVGSAGAVDSSHLKHPSQKDGKAPAAGSFDTTHGTVDSCSNTGSIKVDTPSKSGKDRFGNEMYAQASNVGGIAGYSRASVSNCTNSATIDAENTLAAAGIVGSLRAPMTSSSMSGNFSEEGGDDGTATQEPIAVSNCTNSGVIWGRAFPAGIAGRAGTYTTVTGCINEAGAWVAGSRPTKPFPSGIVGSTYGTVSYCANLGHVMSATSFNVVSHSYALSGGYYASGIVGNTSRFTDAQSVPYSPMPEAYGCYNAGSIMALSGMRQRALVGDNGGYIHDNLALEGCVSTNDLIYGDDSGEGEASGGVARDNRFATEDELKAETSVADADGLTSISLLNVAADADGWSIYWVKSQDASVNQGFPALNRQAAGWATESIAAATVTLARNAEYTGLVAVPQATVVTASGAQLVQGVDFKVVPQADALEVSAEGTTPYTATVEGIGSYAGTGKSFAYGIGKGDLANCSVTTDAKSFNAAGQVPDAVGVRVITPGKSTVDPAEYTFQIDPSNTNLTDGQAYNVGSYKVLVTANDDSAHFYGSNSSGTFSIQATSVVSSGEDEPTSNYAQPQGIRLGDTEIAWHSMTQHPNATIDELKEQGIVFEYTGTKLQPEVTGVVLSGVTVDGQVPLVLGTDYVVQYGKTAVSGTMQTSDNIGVAGGDAIGYVLAAAAPGSNYSNYDVMRFVISDTGSKIDLSKAEIRGDDDIIYEDGLLAYEPIQVWYGGSQLREGTDYEITYAANDAVGTATYQVTALAGGKFQGSLSGTFQIVEGDPIEFAFSLDAATGTATVTGFQYTGNREAIDLVIPSTAVIDGVEYPVTAVGDKAFGSNNTSEITDAQRKIASVTIPASIESIGSYAFCTTNISVSGASNIAQVNLPQNGNLTTIGEGAFCQTGITDLVIPASVKSIGSYAFSRSASLKTVKFETKDADAPAFGANVFRFVYNVDATYDAAAAAVDVYVTKTIASQKWVAHKAGGQTEPETPETPGKPGSGGTGSSGSASPKPSDPGSSSGSASSGNAAKPGQPAQPSEPAQPEAPAQLAASWNRLYGSIALDTMAAIVQEGGFAQGGVVVLTTNAGYWDALTAAGVAGMAGAPVLMTDGGTLSDQTRSLIAGLNPSTVVVCGGSAAVTDGVADAAAAAAGGAKVVRCWGAMATDTANDIFGKAEGITGGTWSRTAFVCTSQGYWDALSAAPISYARQMPIFLTVDSTQISQATLATMKGSIDSVYIVGGEAAIGKAVEKQLADAGIRVDGRLWGATALETSSAVAEFGLSLGMSCEHMGAATNGGYWDALAGAALCGFNDSVLVLVGDASSSSIAQFIAAHSAGIGRSYVFGGPAAVSDATYAAITAATK